MSARRAMVSGNLFVDVTSLERNCSGKRHEKDNVRDQSVG
jgi:hypothetical protein